MLAHRLRRRTSITPALEEPLVFAGYLRLNHLIMLMMRLGA